MIFIVEFQLYAQKVIVGYQLFQESDVHISCRHYVDVHKGSGGRSQVDACRQGEGVKI